MTNEKDAPRGTIATVVATAAVTVAVGVTAASLGGYLVPLGQTEPTTLQTGSAGRAVTAAPPETPTVVLVPVAADDVPQAAPPRAAEPPEVVAGFKGWDPDDEREAEYRRERRGLRAKHREHHDEDDHDDH